MSQGFRHFVMVVIRRTLPELSMIPVVCLHYTTLYYTKPIWHPQANPILLQISFQTLFLSALAPPSPLSNAWFSIALLPRYGKTYQRKHKENNTLVLVFLRRSWYKHSPLSTPRTVGIYWPSVYPNVDTSSPHVPSIHPTYLHAHHINPRSASSQ